MVKISPFFYCSNNLRNKDSVTQNISTEEPWHSPFLKGLNIIFICIITKKIKLLRQQEKNVYSISLNMKV